MELGQIGGLATFVTASVTCWRVFGEGMATRRSGKRLSYSFHVPSKSIGSGAIWMKLFPGFRNQVSRASLQNDRVMELLIFLWNSGSEPLNREDFFPKNSLRIHVHEANITSASMSYLSHSTVGADAYVSSNVSEWQSAPRGKKAGAVEVRFEYLPPNHGVVFKLALSEVHRRVPIVNVVGPVRGLKRTTYLGTLVSLPLDNDTKLRRLGAWIGPIVNVALAAMGGAIVAMVLTGAFVSGLGDVKYWVWLSVICAFEVIYLLARDLRAQLMYRIPNKLAYWDLARCERD